jgi:hypothetical protein
MTTASKRTLFNLGQIVIAANAAVVLEPLDILYGILRHASGDWGTICPHDAALNDEAITAGDRIVSAYGTEERSFWIITEADRSATTILMPEDY